MKTLIVLMVLPFMMSGCGFFLLKSILDKDERTYDNSQDARITFEQSTVECDSGNCEPSAAGLYLFVGEKTIGSCSATLIAPNKILTNAHCIPSSSSFKGASCRGRIKINFPATSGYSAERYDCGTVVNYSEDFNGSYVTKKSPFYELNMWEFAKPDYAVITMNGTSPRPPAEISRTGLEENSSIQMNKVDFNLHLGIPSVGKMKTTTCLANTNYAGSEQSIGAMSALFNLSDCDVKVIPGNSGTGVFTAQNKLAGVFAFAALLDDNPNSNDWESQYQKDQFTSRFPNVKQNSGGGTNISCYDVLEEGTKLDARCFFNWRTYPDLATVYTKVKQARESIGLYARQDGIGLESFEKSFNDHGILIADNSSELVVMMDLNPTFYLFSENDHYDSARFVMQEYVQTMVPMLPKCAPKGLDESRVFELPVNKFTSEQPVIDQISIYSTQEMEREIIGVQFEWDIRGYYMMKPDNRFAEIVSRKHLSEMTYSNTTIDLKVPTCP